jgi:hypothetical protein
MVGAVMSDKKKVKKSGRRPKRIGAEKVLHEARRNPSPTCNDPRQLTLEDAIKQRAFASLDAAIKQTLEGQ